MLKIKEAREAAGLKQKEVEKFLNVTPATYSRYESGLIQPDPAMLIKIASVLGTSIDYLLGRAGPDLNKPLNNPKIQEIVALYEKLPDDKKELVLAMARAMVND